MNTSALRGNRFRNYKVIHFLSTSYTIKKRCMEWAFYEKEKGDVENMGGGGGVVGVHCGGGG